MTPLLAFLDRLRVRGSSRDARPYFHSTPLLWPSISALAGATIGNAICGLAALCAAAAATIAIWRGRDDPESASVASPGIAPEPSETRHMGPLILALLFFALGCVRGALWRGEAAWARDLASGGACRIVLVPLVPAVRQGQGEATFRARLFAVEPLDGSLPGDGAGRNVEITAFSRDISKVVPGRPMTATGSFFLPLPALNPGEFDLRKHLASERTFVCFECSRLETAVPEAAPALTRLYPAILGAVRPRVERSIRACLPAEEGAVVEAVLLGDRSGISYSTSLSFERSGFYRFATIAGFHVDAVFSLSATCFRKVSRKPRLSACLAGLATFFYAGLSGWTPGAIRAFVCALMRASAPEARARYNAMAGLSVAAVVAAWLVPFPLGDTGLQLSFAGAVGSYLGGRCAPVIHFRSWAAPKGFLRVAGIFAVLLPITASSFQDVSLAGFVAGGLWAAAVTFLLPSSLLTVVFPVAGSVAGWIPYTLIRGILQVTSWISLVPASSLAVPAPGRLESAAYYALLLVFMTWVEERLMWTACRHGRPHSDGDPGSDSDSRGSSLPARWRPGASVICCAAILAGAAVRVHPPWLEVTFISAGQADCALVRYRGATMLVDAGTAAACQGSILPYLTRLGVSSIDLCALSHLHDDHAGGLPTLCAALPVDEVMTGTGSAGAARALASVEGPDTVEAGPGSTFSLGGLTIMAACVPGTLPDPESQNDQSLVLVVSGPAGFSAEFWGDAPSEPVAAMLEAYPHEFLDRGVVRVAKVPHHGSRDSLTPGFYERLTPGLAVVSVGPNVYGHPSPQVIQAAAGAGARLLRTDVDGAVTVRWLLGRVWVTSYAGE